MSSNNEKQIIQTTDTIFTIQVISLKIKLKISFYRDKIECYLKKDRLLGKWPNCEFFSIFGLNCSLFSEKHPLAKGKNKFFIKNKNVDQNQMKEREFDFKDLIKPTSTFKNIYLFLL